MFSSNSHHSTLGQQRRIELEDVLLEKLVRDFRIEIWLVTHQLWSRHGNKLITIIAIIMTIIIYCYYFDEQIRQVVSMRMC